MHDGSLSIHYLSLTIIVCPLLARCVCTVGFKEPPGAQKDDTDGTVLTQRLLMLQQRCRGVTDSTEHGADWRLVFTGRTVAKYEGGFHLHGCCASVPEDWINCVPVMIILRATT